MTEPVASTDTAGSGEALAPGTVPASRTDNPLRASSTSRTWLALAAFALVLVLLVVFLAQNTSRVPLHFLGWGWHPPLAVALLASVTAGLLLAVISGSLRILQLRRRIHRDAKQARR